MHSSFTTGFNFSGDSSIQTPNITNTGPDALSSFVLAPLCEDEIGSTGHRFSRKRGKKNREVFDTQMCLPEREMDANDIEHFRDFKTRNEPEVLYSVMQ